jgi:hypothetical protein
MNNAPDRAIQRAEVERGIKAVFDGIIDRHLRPHQRTDPVQRQAVADRIFRNQGV